MDGFAFDQHRDVFLDPGQPGLGLFSDVDPVQDRVAIGAIKRFEKAFRRLVFGSAAGTWAVLCGA